MYRYIHGYHGTTLSEAEALSRGEFTVDPSELTPPRGTYRWLGTGLYFFQDSRALAEKWAREKASVKGGTPAVLKARIDLQNCLDLLETSHIERLRIVYRSLDRAGLLRPQKPLTIVSGEVITRAWIDNTWRRYYGLNYADFEVIEDVITRLAHQGRTIESVRSVFLEGLSSSRNSWIFDRAHVAIAIRRPFKRFEAVEIIHLQ